MKVYSALVAIASMVLSFQVLANSDESVKPPKLPTNYSAAAPSLGMGLDNANQPTFFIYHDSLGYEPASASRVQGMFDKLMKELSVEICQARFRPDYVTVSAGVVKVQWDVNNVCKGRRSKTTPDRSVINND